MRTGLKKTRAALIIIAFCKKKKLSAIIIKRSPNLICWTHPLLMKKQKGFFYCCKDKIRPIIYKGTNNI
jgi:hypothetical protein